MAQDTFSNNHPTTEILATYIDGGLTWAEWKSVEMHLLVCPLCRSVLELQKQLKKPKAD
jgi:anti-sigma factor ChrR (cupin superfamily)